MPGLIQKSAYIPSGKAGGYMNYIATREGVELLRENGYLNYIAYRPGVEKQGSHGLFGSRDGVALSTAQAELKENQGPVWTLIFSLRREDAARLGYDRAESWKQLLYHLSRVFRENAIAPANPQGIRIDSRRRKKLMEKRLALGHKPNDREQHVQV